MIKYILGLITGIVICNWNQVYSAIMQITEKISQN